MARGRQRTSRAAFSAIALVTGRLRVLAYQLIHAAGPRGMTALEVVDAAKEERWSIQPRISELVSDKVVVDSGRTRTNPSGRQAIVWIVPPSGTNDEPNGGAR